MAKRKLEYRLISFEEIDENIKYIENSDNYYISDKGNVYILYHDNKYLKKKNNLVHDYCYCGIKYNGKMISKRVHKLVAIAFVENPNKKENIVVGHKNNIKNDNRKENLYWTTIAENTKKAYKDGLAKNASGYEDSQSMPVYLLDLDGNILKDYGSIRLCAKDVGVSMSTVIRQCKHETKGKPRCGYRFRFQKEYNEKGFVL